MVHQHFMLVPVFTVAESVALGYEPAGPAGILRLDEARRRVKEISDRFGFQVDPDALIEDLPATGKDFYLYDLFEHSADMDHGAMPEHGEGLYEQVVARFADLPNVHVTKGSVPEVLAEKSPEKIAFLHVDMNSATAELGALETLFDRVSPGASIVLDDYGWAFYRDQKVREDAFFAARGYQVLDLPTGQGLVIK